MFKRLLTLLLLIASAAPASADDAVLYRVFLIDGTALISYGEFARVSDRVVFSIPLGETVAAPNLQLVSIPESSVDWGRTDRYAQAVRARRYGETRGELDFALLGARVAEALNDIALTPNPARRLAMALEARGNLARWPTENFGYRAADIGQLVGMLDEVISELRVAAGQSSFDVSLFANVAPPALEPLMSPPTFRETMEQAVAAASATVEPAERVSLLRSVAAALQEPSRTGSWAADLYTRASSELAAEIRVDQSYGALSTSTIASATTRAARGDVMGVQSLVQAVLKADDRLGRRRPQETSALLALLDYRLDEARRLRLAHDAWSMRLDLFRTYRRSIAPMVAELRRSSRSLERIRELAGPDPIVLPHLDQRLLMARQQLAMIAPPIELESAHGLFTTALQMARRAVLARRNAVSSGDMKLAWEASSAAAGALMLLDRAGQELDRLTTPPRLR